MKWPNFEKKNQTIKQSIIHPSKLIVAAIKDQKVRTIMAQAGGINFRMIGPISFLNHLVPQPRRKCDDTSLFGLFLEIKGSCLVSGVHSNGKEARHGKESDERENAAEMAGGEFGFGSDHGDRGGGSGGDRGGVFGFDRMDGWSSASKVAKERF